MRGTGKKRDGARGAIKVNQKVIFLSKGVFFLLTSPLMDDPQLKNLLNKKIGVDDLQESDVLAFDR